MRASGAVYRRGCSNHGNLRRLCKSSVVSRAKEAIGEVGKKVPSQLDRTCAHSSHIENGLIGKVKLPGDSFGCILKSPTDTSVLALCLHYFGMQRVSGRICDGYHFTRLFRSTWCSRCQIAAGAVPHLGFPGLVRRPDSTHSTRPLGISQLTCTALRAGRSSAHLGKAFPWIPCSWT